MRWGDIKPTFEPINSCKIPSVEKVKHLAMHASCISSLRNQATKLQLLIWETLQNCRFLSIFAQKGKKQEPIKIHSSQPMSSLTTMLPSIHKEAIGGRSDGTTTHGALAKLLATMTISANHMATWHQRHSRPMLLTNGTSGTGALTRLGRGHCARGIFRAPPHINSDMRARMRNVHKFHLCLWKSQLQEKFQQPLSHHLLLRLSAVLRGHGIIYVTRATPAFRSLLTFLHEVVLDVSKPSLVHIPWLPCQLLTEWHDEERRIRKMAFKAQEQRDCWWPNASAETTLQRS